MDEPMSALDKRLREEMQFEVRRLQRRLGITTIAVTHDQVEALVMSDAIIVLNKGRIEQSGRPDEVYRSPRSEFVANFLGESNLFRGSIEENDSAPVLVCGANVRIPVGQIAGANRGARVVYVVRPECVAIDAPPAPGQIAIRGRVTEAIFAGEAVRVTIESGLGTPVVAKILSNASTVLPRASDEVTVSWLPADAAIFPE
jgi:putative spermidine/putrescine transport system ATP-binding protein